VQNRLGSREKGIQIYSSIEIVALGGRGNRRGKERETFKSIPSH